jgi:hypothetical protein
MLVTMGLAWLGGGKPIPKMISAFVMGSLFIFLGHNFVARGRSLSICATSKDSETARNDRIAARRMVVQAIWIGAFIVVAVGLVVGLLLFLARRSAGCPAERTATVSRNGVKTDRITFSILPGSPSLYLPVDR